MFKRQTAPAAAPLLTPEMQALYRSQAVIEFSPDGVIQYANENFLAATGYTLGEIKGKHHSMFMAPEDAQSPDYRAFWQNLRNGEFDMKEYRRFGKGGREIWIQASYNPVLDKNGNVVRIIKFATDITASKLHSADYNGQIQAINKSQAVIEFDLDGIILNANGNFLNAVGYTIDEVKGAHHRMFVPAEYAKSEEYAAFWRGLREGHYDHGEYKRIGKDGREIWIQASYNPIFDMNGKPFKVVKYASDITEQKIRNADFREQIAAINKAQAVVEFDLDGIVRNANENFLKTMGYTIEEIRGQHHRMFVEPALAASEEYAAFWDNLRNGIFDARVYKRVAKGGREVWIQASYNPILDDEGRPMKVVKYASDITDMIDLTQRTTENVNKVSGATEELLSSIDEISQNMSKTESATESILQQTRSAGESSSRLVEATKLMEGIVNLIRDIAGKVNLLALNATIEAARAGEAGKGFAVVASEVKNLATATTAATNDIEKEISTVQTISGEVANDVEQIVEGGQKVEEYVSAVSQSLNRQSQITHDMAHYARLTLEDVQSMTQKVRGNG